MRFIHVTWNDAVGTSSRATYRAYELGGLTTLETVGIFVTENDDVLVLAQDKLADDDVYRITLTIPKSLIVKRRWLK